MSSVLEKDKQYVWHPFTQMKTAGEPLDIVKAKGSYLYDRDGKSYLDCNSSWWVNVHGHCHSHITKKIMEQIKQIDHVIFAGATHEQAVKLAERVVKLLPENFQKVFFSDNGSTAVEVALKMVFQYWHNLDQSKTKILALEGAYHGDTFGAMSVGQRGYFNKPFESFFFNVDFLEFPTPEKEKSSLKKAEELFQTGNFAAVIVEPLIQGSAGMVLYSHLWLDAFVKLAKKYNVKVIFDEVMTAWGRTGKYFAMNYCQEIPDIVCLSKGLTGGVLPLGLTVATDEIYNAFLAEDKAKALLHGHSFTGNSIACAAANASLDLFEIGYTWKRIERIGAKHLTFKNQIQEHKKIKEVRVLGTILAIEIQIGEESSYFAKIREDAYHFFLEKGMLIRPLGNIVFINPPYSIKDEELDLVYIALTEFINKIY
ncbi:MAG: adenosylmethionine--8-amino-7-oxononanoate transaminase [Flavobacteriia bacterium]|nr:adenosylmethionine--8-amino-7-oxononanoate transaminase [Flavobacteriia bacterium]